MGIPYLAATLEPYAVHRHLQDEPVVVDGPALAYHILHVCRVNGISQPSYSILGQTTLAWLDELSSRGVTTQAIYFDGYLPTAKRPVRMQRLVNSTAQIIKFYSSNLKGCPWSQVASVGDKDGNGQLDLLKTGPPGTKPFADPGFLVPAIIDALRQSSQYQDLVSLVPGEADVYCAKHLFERGGSVLTSDSDLLAHNLGDGQVVFFRDIHRDATSAILCASFAPKQICHTLGLSPSENLTRLAYERKELPSVGLSHLVSACSRPVTDQCDYNIFRQEYENRKGDGMLEVQWPQLNRLDPRVSEIVVQLRHPPSTPENDDGDVRIYLPVLIENPTRGNAWEQSTPIRQLAYTLLGLASPRCTSILEYRRIQSPAQKGRAVEMLSEAEVQEVIEYTLDLMGRVKRATRGQEGVYWPILCLALDINECRTQGKQSHAWQTFQQRDKAGVGKSNKISWDFVHFVAQLQATCYSLRILRQGLSIVLDDGVELVPPKVKQLHMALLDLPPLADFPDINGTLDLVATARQNGLTRTLGELLGVSPPLTPKPSEGFKVSKNGKKRTGSKGRDETSQNLTLTSKTSSTRNKFSLLPVD